MVDLLDLAGRCERATGRSISRNRAIAIATGWRESNGSHMLHPPGDDTGRQFAPDYTGSASDATALLPSHLYWMMAKGRNRPEEPLYAIQIIDPETRSTVAQSESDSLEGCICAAALRARHALGVVGGAR